MFFSPKGPSGKRVNKVVKRRSSGVYQVEYIPTEVGKYNLHCL